MGVRGRWVWRSYVGVMVGGWSWWSGFDVGRISHRLDLLLALSLSLSLLYEDNDLLFNID